MKKFYNRFTILYIFICVFFSVLALNLIRLQIVKGNENLYLSSAIRTSEEVIRASRGLIYDRDGNILVANKPSFRLIVDLTQLQKDKEKDVLHLLSQILNIDEGALWNDYEAKVYDEKGNRASLSQIMLLSDIERDQVISLYSRSEELPGIFIEAGTTREYVDAEVFAHVLGYVREVSKNEIDTGNYSIGDMIGATGLEQYYDGNLRGNNGKKVIEHGTSDREAITEGVEVGQSLKLSINSDMQKKLTEVLAKGIKNNNAVGGAAVIEDISTGEILALVSLPTFDLNQMVKGLSYDEYMNLTQDPSLPLYNRAISLTQPPGSTFKTIVASAALEEGAITPSTVFESKGCMDLGGGLQFCEAGKALKGNLDMYHGLSRSSNVYFCNTMLRLGIDKLNKYTTEFGLGQKTGIDLGGEQPGAVASKKLKLELQGEQWYPGDACNTGIGQGLMRVSPIQMVSWATSIANGGTYYKPHLVTSILDSNGKQVETVQPVVLHDIPVSDKNLEAVREGMHLAVNDPWGSAFPLRGLKSDVSAKTGSAESYRKINGVFVTEGHSWVTGFFPYDKPRYAFVVYLEFGGWGFHSAEVMRDFLLWYESTNSI